MIYSEDVNRVCGLCRHAEKLTDEEMYCRLQRQNMNVTAPDCGKFDYDIFKKTVRRKKRFRSDFNSEDFSLN